MEMLESIQCDLRWPSFTAVTVEPAMFLGQRTRMRTNELRRQTIEETIIEDMPRYVDDVFGLESAIVGILLSS